MKTLKAISSLLLYSLLLSGCATKLTGPVFKPVEMIPQNKALVYVYWTNAEEGKRIDFELYANGISKVDMKSGGYFVFESGPGELDLEASPNFTFGQMALLDMATTFNEHLILDIEPNKKYFVSCTLSGYQGSYKLPMELVSEQRGLTEIESAKLLPPRKQ